MDLGVLPANKHILDWDESDVHQWFKNLGYSQYETQIKTHKIRGDSLCAVDLEGLKSLGVVTIGQRLSILKSIYHVKLAQNMTFSEDDYIPPSEAPERVVDISPEKLHTVVKDQAQRIRVLEEEYRQLSQTNRSFHEAIAQVRATLGLPPGPELTRSPLAWIQNPQDSEQVPAAYPTPSETPAPTLVDGSDANNTKVGLEDPTSKVLPAALRKNKIKEEEWGDYAMFITYYGSLGGNRIRRRLEPDEKPLYLFKKLRDGNQNPAFVLKNIKDLRSPVEQEK